MVEEHNEITKPPGQKT